MPRETRRPGLAIALMLGATAAFVAMQALVKVGRESGLDTTEVMFFRTAPGLPILYLALRRRGFGIVPSEPRDVIVRSVLGTFAMATNFAAMGALTLAQFSTLNLLQPVFVALCSPLVLSEPVKRHAWTALPLALAGSLFVVIPGLESHSMATLPAALALASALFSAFAQMWVRKATVNDPPERVVFHFAALVSLATLGLGLARGHVVDVPHGGSRLVFLLEVVGLAGFGTLGQVLMTRAYSVGEAATVAMVAYIGLVMSLGVDAAWFDVVPTGWALLGAALMVAAGYTLVQGERRATRRA